MSEESSPDQERQQELDKLEARVEVINKLTSGALGKLIIAQDSATAQEAWFKILFFDSAAWHAQSMAHRLEGTGATSEEMELASENQSFLKKISEEGKWEPAKGYTGYQDMLGEYIDRSIWNLPNGLEYKGVELFDEFKVADEDYHDLRNPLLDELVQSKLKLVPDKTEPYSYPRMQEIERAAYR